MDSLNGVINRLREGTAQRHVHNGLAGAVRCRDVVSDPLHALYDTRVGARARGIEDLDGDEGYVLGDTEGPSSESAGHVASVPVFIRIL